MNRDLVTERWLILEACKAYGFDGSDVADFAMGRAGFGPWRDLPNRNFGLEGKEEGGDGLMYGCGAVEQLSLFPDSEFRCEAMTEIGHLMRCAAGMTYHADRLRELMRHIRESQPVAA